MLGDHITKLRNETDRLKLTILGAKVEASLVGPQWGPCFPSSSPNSSTFLSASWWLAHWLRLSEHRCSVKCTNIHSRPFGKPWSWLTPGSLPLTLPTVQATAPLAGNTCQELNYLDFQGFRGKKLSVKGPLDGWSPDLLGHSQLRKAYG